ncbi:hypothetical protein PR048_016675 [Dryococelus australis]|uniref:Uncharacterized protein n=1 Tax=Dryococelus australis TaxID=614101 RepID=A0ABQ9H7E1_9NEOP|nr:hypothetical protein PR048_016675 [Dryococelus australis]
MEVWEQSEKSALSAHGNIEWLVRTLSTNSHMWSAVRRDQRTYEPGVVYSPLFMKTVTRHSVIKTAKVRQHERSQLLARRVRACYTNPWLQSTSEALVITLGMECHMEVTAVESNLLRCYSPMIKLVGLVVKSLNVEACRGQGTSYKQFVNARKMKTASEVLAHAAEEKIKEEKQPAISQLSLYLPRITEPPRRGRGYVVVRLLAFHPGEPGSIPGGVALGFSYVGIVQDDTAGRRVFSGISRFPRPCILMLLHTHLAVHYTPRQLPQHWQALGGLVRGEFSNPRRAAAACDRHGNPAERGRRVPLDEPSPHPPTTTNVILPSLPTSARRRSLATGEQSKSTDTSPEPPWKLSLKRARGNLSHLGGSLPQEILSSNIEYETSVSERPLMFSECSWQRGGGTERLSSSPPAGANRTQPPAGPPDFRLGESCRTIPLVGGFSRRPSVSPTVSFRRYSILTSIILIGSQGLVVKSRPNLFTRSLRLYLKCFNSADGQTVCCRPVRRNGALHTDGAVRHAISVRSE